MIVCKVVEVDVEFDLELGVNLDWIIDIVNCVDFEKIKFQEDDVILCIKLVEKK